MPAQTSELRLLFARQALPGSFEAKKISNLADDFHEIFKNP